MPDPLKKMSDAIGGSSTINTVRIIKGIWVQAEVVDSNLSQVTVSGVLCRWIPKFLHVSTILVGQEVTMMADGNQYTIIGVSVGDTTLADAGE